MLHKIIDLHLKKEKEYSAVLKDVYKYYTTNISNDGMAASLRTCVFLVCMMEVLKPHNVLDLGSGISSYTLRYFKQALDLSTKIISVDSDVNWLNKSKNFCLELDVDTEHFYHWTEVNMKKIPCELIFMDIDRTKPRLKYYDPVCKRFSVPGGMMLVDDMHKTVLRHKVQTIGVPHIRYDVTDQTKFRKRYNWVLEFIENKKA